MRSSGQLRLSLKRGPTMKTLSSSAIQMPYVRPAKESKERPKGWRLIHLLWAPHRIAFFLAMCLLAASAFWWLLVHLDRLGLGPGLTFAVSPTVTHAVVMTFGFFPLFFTGFMFTAGPKWLGVKGPDAHELLLPLLFQFAGWLGWLASSYIGPTMASVSGAVAAAGWALVCRKFWGLIVRSRAADKVHAKLIAWSGLFGCVYMVAVMFSTSSSQIHWALAFTRTGLWVFVVTTFLVVTHRMLPFFTSSALPVLDVWRPWWVLWFLTGIVFMEAGAIWLPVALDWVHWQGIRSDRAWMLAQGLLELASGSAVLWLAFVWGLVQSLKVRLLAMLHAGFLWFGIALVLSGASQLLGLTQGVPILGLGALHALNMGFLGSVLLAMVTRVSCGHGGRTLVADNVVWALFVALQFATVMRILSALEQAPNWLSMATAAGWLVVMAVWGAKLSGWYGRPRADGKPD